MASTGTNDTQCKVATLKLGLQDMLACYMLEEVSAGFRKRQANSDGSSIGAEIAGNGTLYRESLVGRAFSC